MTVPVDPRKLADTVREALVEARHKDGAVAEGEELMPGCVVCDGIAALDALVSLAEQGERECGEAWTQYNDAEADNARLRAQAEQLRTERDEARAIIDDWEHQEDAVLADLERERAARESAERERDLIGAALGEQCAECGHIDWRSDGYLDAVLARESARYDDLQEERDSFAHKNAALETISNRAVSAEAALRSAQAEVALAQARADELEKALVLVRDWVREGNGTESDAAEAMDAALAASPQADPKEGDQYPFDPHGWAVE